jgi:hypothetical protein
MSRNHLAVFVALPITPRKRIADVPYLCSLVRLRRNIRARGTLTITLARSGGRDIGCKELYLGRFVLSAQEAPRRKAGRIHSDGTPCSQLGRLVCRPDER